MSSIPSDKKPPVRLDDLISTANSVVRILATAAIFVFHCDARYGYDAGRLLPGAFAAFLFLTGYYALLKEGERPSRWITRRLQRIYLPYWITIAGALIANFVVQYKPVDWSAIVSLVIGANWLHPNPLYVIAWYVSLVVYLYLSMFVYYVMPNAFLQALAAILAAAGLIRLGAQFYFLGSFLLGFGLANLRRWSGVAEQPLNWRFFPTEGARREIHQIQNHTYEFFLLHGGIILFYQEILGWSFQATFWGALATSLVFSVALRRLTQMLSTRVLGWA